MYGPISQNNFSYFMANTLFLDAIQKSTPQPLISFVPAGPKCSDLSLQKQCLVDCNEMFLKDPQ